MSNTFTQFDHFVRLAPQALIFTKIAFLDRCFLRHWLARVWILEEMISQAGILPTSLLGSHFFGKSSKHLEKKDLQRCYDFAHEKNARRKLLVYELTCNLLVNLWIPYFRKMLHLRYLAGFWIRFWSIQVGTTLEEKNLGI